MNNLSKVGHDAKKGTYVKPRYIPAWLDKLLWHHIRSYRRDRMRSAHTFRLDPIQVEYLREKLTDEALGENT